MEEKNMNSYTVLLLLIYGLSSAFGAVLLKNQLEKTIINYMFFKNIYHNFLIQIALLLNVLIPLSILIYLIQDMDVSILHPSLSITYIFAYLISIVYYKARFTITGFLGLVLIILGIIIFSLENI